MDQSKKTMRHFYCRDVLWETFEQMANDFDCSIDYLVNEAMRYYARSKNYQSPGGPQMTGGGAGRGQRSGPTSYPPQGRGAAGAARATGRPSRRRSRPAAAPSVQRRAGPRRRRPGTRPAQRRRQRRSRRPADGRPTGPRRTRRRRPPRADAAAMGAAGPTLFLIYNGQRTR